MALIKCPDCGHDVSDRATACVNCGAPIAAPAAPPDVCEVVLRRISGLGIFGGARWILEGQVMTRSGITVVASCEYSSDNELANYQGSKREFHKARASITNQLLRAGWEPLPSISGGDAISLPRFQRRSGVDKTVFSADGQNARIQFDGETVSVFDGRDKLRRHDFSLVSLRDLELKRPGSASGILQFKVGSEILPHGVRFGPSSADTFREFFEQLSGRITAIPATRQTQLSPEAMHEVKIKALAEYLEERDRREEAELEAAGAVSERPDEWWPTHLVPKGGMPFWASSDMSQRPAGQLPGEVELMMESDPQSGQSAQVAAMDGWEGWVDGRLLEEVPNDWKETHHAPAGGMPFWKSPDPSQRPTGQLPARTRLVLNSRSGVWANVTAPNGWRGWVDGRLLEKCD